jgi:uncharacterized protein
MLKGSEMFRILESFLIISIIFTFISCGKKYTPKQEKYIKSIEKFRQEKNKEMKNDPSSPFNQDKNAHFKPLNYFDVNPNFVFKSKLFRYDKKDTVIIFGTKGEKRKIVRFGYVYINYKNNKYKLNVYKGTTPSGTDYYTIWFTDKTTGNETYGVGRYLDFDLNPDSNYVYTIDFNLAYNPYCAYSAKYSCAIPSKEDHLELAVDAGEKNFH